MSVVLPIFHEGDGIARHVERLAAFLDKRSRSWEIVVVDDGSRDHALSALEESLKTWGPRLRLLRLETNRGKGCAVAEGMVLASGEYCFFTDGDLPYDLEALWDALRLLRQGRARIVAGDRSHPCRRAWFPNPSNGGWPDGCSPGWFRLWP